MRKLMTLVVVSSVLAGCASPLPICDGKDRRPINVPAHAQVGYPSCGAAA